MYYKKTLYLLVEGGDDYLFFSEIGTKLLENELYSVALVEYAGKTPKEINKQLEGFLHWKNEYIFFTDIDRAKSPAQCKEIKKKKYKMLDKDRICVVNPEIESWYLAGLDSRTAKPLGFEASQFTNETTKEKFDKIIPKQYRTNSFTRRALLRKMLLSYSVNLARKKNRSFGDFFKSFIVGMK